MKKDNHFDARAKLLSTAKKLFAKKEFSAVSIRELAHDANVNSAGISYHFGSKLGLYKTLLQMNLKITLERTKSIEISDLSPNQKLIEFQKTIIEQIQKEPNINLLLHRALISSKDQKIIKLINKVYIIPLMNRLHEITSSCSLNKKFDFLTAERIIFVMIALPAYWSIFHNGYKGGFPNQKDNKNQNNEVFSFTLDMISHFLDQKQM